MSLRYTSQAVRSAAARSSAAPMARFAAPAAVQQTRASSGHAIANPTLAGIEKRWEDMPPQEQADLWMQLRDRMKVNWHEMTLQEKKAGMLLFLSVLFQVTSANTTRIAYWIAFGAHGPRKETPKGEGWKILSKVTQLVAVSVALFYSTRLFAGSPPRTMTKEWQEASNEYALVRTLISLSLYYIYILTTPAEREDGPHHRYQQRGLPRRRFRAEQTRKVFINYQIELDSGRENFCKCCISLAPWLVASFPRSPSLETDQNMYCLLCYNQSISFV